MADNVKIKDLRKYVWKRINGLGNVGSIDNRSTNRQRLNRARLDAYQEILHLCNMVEDEDNVNIEQLINEKLGL